MDLILICSCVCRALIEQDVIQEGARSLSRRPRHGTDGISHAQRGGRSLKDVREGLAGIQELDLDDREGDGARGKRFEAEVGRVLLQWGQSAEGLQAMLLQVNIFQLT